MRVQTNIPIFKKQESSVRRRYSDFCWLKDELTRDTKVAAWEIRSLTIGCYSPTAGSGPCTPNALGCWDWRCANMFFIFNIGRIILWRLYWRASCWTWKLSEQVSQSPFLCSWLRLSGHPLAQNEKSLHMFLQENEIDKEYVPGKMRKK